VNKVDEHTLYVLEEKVDLLRRIVLHQASCETINLQIMNISIGQYDANESDYLERQRELLKEKQTPLAKIEECLEQLRDM